MSKTTCPACGNNQISHWSEYLSSSVELAIIPIELATNRLGLHQALNTVAELILRTLTKVLILFKIAKFSSDSNLKLSPRAEVLKEEAVRRGIKMETLIVGNKVTDNFRAQIKGRTIYFTNLPRPQETPALVWIDDKARLKKLFQKNNIPSPQGTSSRDFNTTARFARTTHHFIY
jgi:hypothetical protein